MLLEASPLTHIEVQGEIFNDFAVFFSFIAVCTPIGFIRLFSVVGQVLVKPNLLRDVNEEFQTFNMEEASVKRKINNNKGKGYSGSFFRKF